eukprot:6301060-Amphidinium_carterae.1
MMLAQSQGTSNRGSLPKVENLVCKTLPINAHAEVTQWWQQRCLFDSLMRTTPSGSCSTFPSDT